MSKPKKTTTVPREPADELTVTQAARQFSDVINRVRYRGERFMLTKGAVAVAELRPVASARLVTGRDLARRLRAMPHLGSAGAAKFASDLDEARKSAGKAGPGP